MLLPHNTAVNACALPSNVQQDRRKAGCRSSDQSFALASLGLTIHATSPLPAYTQKTTLPPSHNTP
jgi:hypothetical protein